LERVLWLAIFLLGLAALFAKEARFHAFTFIIIIAYFTLTTGIVAQSRYRIPIEPFMFINAAVGFFTIKKYLSLNKNSY
jgi:hypothetical protein